jgi:cytochrome c peroxidase
MNVSPVLAVLAVLAGCARGPALTSAAATPSAPGLSPVATLGERLFKDPSLSVSGRLSCETCHQPRHAHAAPPGEIVSVGGAAHDQRGLRNAPSIRYAGFTPRFAFDEEGTPFGGLFRDGRVDSLAEQARQPFLDRREMANASVDGVIERLRRSPNANRFRAVYGKHALDDPSQALDRITAAIAQYEVENRDFHRFDSKYDAWLEGRAELSAQEQRGLALFEDPGKGNCVACHPSKPGADGTPPLFTDFTYDNVGLPRNAAIPANSDRGFFDLGLCGPERKDLTARRDLCGAFKVPTLRNVARTAPYFHNGGFRTLREAVAFYARRDTHAAEWYPSRAGVTDKFDDLPPSLREAVNTLEVPYDRKPGESPALTPAEIDDIVAFLKTLDDGYN